MRFAYADPPYPGLAKYYRNPDDRSSLWYYPAEVDHQALIRRLTLEYPDGWALSTSAAAVRDVWALCPTARLCVWVKAARLVKVRRMVSTWEALLVAGGRDRQNGAGPAPTDALVYRGRHRAFPGALVGMKPPAFAEWMFRLLGAGPGDTLDDLFPGSGAITEAWRRFTGESEEPQWTTGPDA